MLSWTQLRNRSSRLIGSLTGLNRCQIEKLLPTFKPALKTHKSSWVVVAPDKRQRKTGAGRTPRLNSADLFILILVYFGVILLRTFWDCYSQDSKVGFVNGCLA